MVAFLFFFFPFASAEAMLLSSCSVWCCSAPRSGLSHACFPLGGGENRTDLGLQRCCCCYWQMVTALPVGFCSTSPLPGILLLSLSCMSSRTLSLYSFTSVAYLSPVCGAVHGCDAHPWGPHTAVYVKEPLLCPRLMVSPCDILQQR